MNLSVKNFEKQSTFGLVMDNIIVACFFDSQCRFIAVLSFIMLAHSFEIDNDMMVISVMCHCVFLSFGSENFSSYVGITDQFVFISL